MPTMIGKASWKCLNPVLVSHPRRTSDRANLNVETGDEQRGIETSNSHQAPVRSKLDVGESIGDVRNAHPTSKAERDVHRPIRLIAPKDRPVPGPLRGHDLAVGLDHEGVHHVLGRRRGHASLASEARIEGAIGEKPDHRDRPAPICREDGPGGDDAAKIVDRDIERALAPLQRYHSIFTEAGIRLAIGGEADDHEALSAALQGRRRERGKRRTGATGGLFREVADDDDLPVGLHGHVHDVRVESLGESDERRTVDTEARVEVSC